VAKKYIALTADTEAYFCPPEFEGWQGVFTTDIVRACEETGVPFTWLVICDRESRGGQPREFREIDAVAKTLLGARGTRGEVDEFGLHVHFRYFINDTPDDDESWRDASRRVAFVKAARLRREQMGIPAPVSFRYGGGDMQARLYLAEEFELMHAWGVRNWLLPGGAGGHELAEFQGFSPDEIEHAGNNVWSVRGMEGVTVFRGARSSMELETAEMIRRIDDGLERSDYVVVSCHDYTAAVPANLAAAVGHARERYDCEFVTVGRIGELIRAGELRNE